MVKWKSRHRPDDSSPSPSSSLPHISDSATAPLQVDFDNFGGSPSPQTTPKPSPRLTRLLITEDIEALLQEDERARAQHRQNQEPEISAFEPSSFGGLPPPPRRTHQNRHYKIQSEYRAPPMLSGKSSDNKRDGKDVFRRPSTTAGVVSSSSVSKRSSIKDVSAQKPVEDTYTVRESSSVNEGILENRLSEFGPKTRRSSDGPIRDSWGAASRFSSMTQPSITVDSYSSTSLDLSRTVPPPLPHSRPLLSPAPLASQESLFSTLSSIDPPSTIHEGRISVSSTIYPPSSCNELPSPVAGPVGSNHLGSSHRDSLFYRTLDSGSVKDQDSIIDTFTLGSGESETSGSHQTGYGRPSSIYSRSDEPSYQRNRPGSPRRSLSSLDVSSRRASGQKPALPTAPKPDFARSRSVQPPSRTPMISKPPSRSSSPKLPGLVPYHLLTSVSPSIHHHDISVPPTTNNLNPQERADLVRKTRKLTQVFGQTPSPMSASEEFYDSPQLGNCLLPVIPTRKAHRGAMSVPEALSSQNTRNFRSVPVPPAYTERKESISPIMFRGGSTQEADDSDDSLSPYDSPDAPTPSSSRKKSGDAVIRSPTVISGSDSFIEIAEQDTRGLKRFSSILSLAESITEERRAEEERRRKRERVAKLHRFLGSRVPLELVLGTGLDVPLPPVATDSRQPEPLSDGEVSPSSKGWLRGKRRNSLASSDPNERLPDSERLKAELSEKEKAIVVKRAQKIEKLFGEQPPQNLFHSVNARPVPRAVSNVSQSKLPASSAPVSPVNINKSAYQKLKSKRDNRPGTAESSKRLLGPSLDYGETESIDDGQSDIYYHYRNSLVSLTNIVNTDDKESLVELHEYINEDFPKGNRDKRGSQSSSSIRSDRRRSLPLRASYSSLSSQFTISKTKIEVTPFEVRRRRAAKLSNFFGVSYRDLFGEVLDSLEMSVREDEGKGALNADQAQDLLVQLTKLKARRNELSS